MGWEYQFSFTKADDVLGAYLLAIYTESRANQSVNGRPCASVSNSPHKWHAATPCSLAALAPPRLSGTPLVLGPLSNCPRTWAAHATPIGHGPRYLYVRLNAMKVQWIEKDANYCSPSADPYRLIVISNDQGLARSDIERLAVQIAATPVRLVAAWGHDCSFWDDSIDWSVILRYHPEKTPEAGWVTTTWHEGESITDVLEYVTIRPGQDDYPREDIYILVVGSGLVPREELESVFAAL